MPRTIIDIHVLQTVPPSNLNRDDTGSPKTAVYGGVRRARVSSQAWKRATRDAFAGLLNTSDLGVRTKQVVDLVAAEIKSGNAELAESAATLAEAVLTAAGFKIVPPKKKDAGKSGESEFLLFLGRGQIANLAALAVESHIAADGGKLVVDKTKARLAADTRNSVDVSLFGRMVAGATDLNVEASAQVAHAISVHAAATEYDYFTAVDDRKRGAEDEDAGAGMIGTVEFNSATLYRYANLDVDNLRKNLGDEEATRRAVGAFVRAFITSMPTGKQNTFANRTLPDAVLVVARETQPINLAGAFEDAVTDGEKGGRVAASIARLAGQATELHRAFDEVPLACWSFGVGERMEPLDELGARSTLDQTVAGVTELVVARAGQP